MSTVSARAEAPYNVAWSRQIGTASGDFGNALAVDAAGNAYISGSTEASLGGPNSGGYDAFLTKYNSAGSLLWSRQIGTTTGDYAYGAAVDAVGNAYITGRTHGSLGGPSAGGGDAFLTKYDGAGNLVWSRQIGTAAFDYSYDVAVDATGNAYISGVTEGSLGGPNIGTWDAFLTKYDGTGNVVWTRQIGTEDYDYSLGITVDPFGNAYVSGWTFGSLGGPNVGDPDAPTSDAFLTKYDGAGNLLWSRQIGAAGDDASFGVAVDAAGNAYITGLVNGIGGPGGGSGDAFLTKYDGAGNLVWSRQIGTPSRDLGLAVSVDASGNAYISGETQGSLAGPNAGNTDTFLTKYDAAGNLLWSRQIGTTNDDTGSGVAVDGLGNAYISGYTYGSLGGPNAGDADAFLVKFAVPEPSTFVLAALGAASAALVARRKKYAA